MANPAIRNIIRRGATQEVYSAIELGAQQSMQSMDAALRDLFRKGLISKDQALLHAINRERLEKMLQNIAA